MINVKEIIEWLKNFGGSFVREEPLIVGFVNKHDLKDGDSVDREMLKKLMDWQLPLSFSDLRRLPSNEVLTLSGEQKELMVRRRRKPRYIGRLVEMLLRGEFFGILVPNELYHETYGLTFGGPCHEV